MLNYSELITERTISFIENEFSVEVLQAIDTANEYWEREKSKNLNATMVD